MENFNTIKNKVAEVLKQKHQNKYKQELNDYNDRLNFACPICGDSHTVDTKKRGNIYFKNMWYKCFNCGVSIPLTKFFQEVNVTIDPTTSLEINQQAQEYKATIAQTKSTTLADFKLDKRILLSELSELLNNNPSHKILDFKPVEPTSEVGKYLILNRKIENLENFYQAKYQASPKHVEPVLISLNKTGDVIFGMQLRNLKYSHKQRFFKIINFEELWKMFPDKTPLTEEEFIRYNKLSYVYNLLNVDFNKPITVFEGYIDAVFFPNSIGLVGNNTDYSFLLDESLQVRFFFDNDKAGLKKTKEMIMKGYAVFLWNKFLKTLAKKSKDSDLMYHLLKKEMTDLNAIAKKIHNPYHKLQLEQYFSVDTLDLLEI